MRQIDCVGAQGVALPQIIDVLQRFLELVSEDNFRNLGSSVLSVLNLLNNQLETLAELR